MDEEAEMVMDDDGVYNETTEDEPRKASETVPTKIKPIPKFSAFFILSHTNP